MVWSTANIPPQHGRVVVITGANGGLGKETARALAARGAHVVLAARDQAKAAAATDDILRSAPGASLEVVALDLASLASVAAAAERILGRLDRLDLLINNAGVMAMPQGTTEDGFDTQFGINHLGHWALTSHLLPRLVRTPGARVVSVSSVAQHQGRPVDPADPHLRTDYDPWRMYAQTKLANRHFAQGLQDRFARAGVDATSVACHPGLTHSDLQARTVEAGGGGPLGNFWLSTVRRIGMSVEQGAQSLLRAATDPDAAGAWYYGPLFGSHGPPVRKPLVRPGSERAIEVLWEVSRRETGLDVDVDAALSA